MEDSKNDSKKKNSATAKKVKSKQVGARYTESAITSRVKSKHFLHSTELAKPEMDSTGFVNCSSHSTLPSFGDVSKINPDSSNQSDSFSGRPRDPKNQKPKKVDTKETREAMKDTLEAEYCKYMQSLYVYSELKHSNKEKEDLLTKQLKQVDDAAEKNERYLTQLNERIIFLEEAKKVLEFKEFFSKYLKTASDEVEKVKKRSTELYEAVKKSQDKFSLKGVKPTNAELLQASLNNFEEQTKDAGDLLDGVSGVVSEDSSLRKKLYDSYSKVKEGMKRVTEDAKVMEALYIQKAGLEVLMAS